jgi:hypothetical protein
MSGNNRMSMYSNTSSGPGLPRNLNSAAQQSSQVSTTTLLNAIHTIYTSGQPFPLEKEGLVAQLMVLCQLELGNMQGAVLRMDALC